MQIARIIARTCLLACLIAALSGQTPMRSGIRREDINTTCKPRTDFWRCVNGGWLDKNPIPADEASWGTFGVLADANREHLGTILDAAAGANAAPGSDQRRMGDFYSTCMNTATIDARGYTPLQPDFGLIVERDVAGRRGSSIFSLPDRDYYLLDDDKSKQIRAAFPDHAAKLLELAGTPHAEVAALKALAPNVDWALLPRETGVPESTIVNVSEPGFLKQVNQQLSEAPLESWKIWLRWRDLQLAAPYLAKAFSDEAFHFPGATTHLSERRL